MPEQAERWCRVKQHADGQIFATFLMPSGRIRQVPMSLEEALTTISDLSKAVRYSVGKDTP